jgi:hypothetical protein
MVKKAIFLVAVFATVSLTFAQETNFGLRAGLNLASQKWDASGVGVEMPKFDNTMGFHVGVIADIGISEQFYIQPGLLFSTKGAEYSKSAGGVKNEINISLQYLEVPLMASAKIAINEAMALRINAGPYLDIGLDGTLEIKSSYGGQTVSEKDDAFKNDNYKRLDFGVAFGGGLEFQSIYVGVNYGLGLVNIADSKEIDISNKCLGIALGYNF